MLWKLKRASSGLEDEDEDDDDAPDDGSCSSSVAPPLSWSSVSPGVDVVDDARPLLLPPLPDGGTAERLTKSPKRSMVRVRVWAWVTLSSIKKYE